MIANPNKPKTSIVDAVAKPQTVRLGDVFLFGPLLIYVAMQKGKLSPAIRFSLLSTGIGTIIYNLHNYVQEERRLDSLNRQG